jgi:hypothetical protein
MFVCSPAEVPKSCLPDAALMVHAPGYCGFAAAQWISQSVPGCDGQGRLTAIHSYLPRWLPAWTERGQRGRNGAIFLPIRRHAGRGRQQLQPAPPTPPQRPPARRAVGRRHPPPSRRANGRRAGGTGSARVACHASTHPPRAVRCRGLRCYHPCPHRVMRGSQVMNNLLDNEGKPEYGSLKTRT